MRYLKAMIAGVFFPSILIPILLFLFSAYGKEEVLKVKFFHIIPLLWGVWNILYFALFKDVFPGTEIVKLLLTGAILGLVVAIIAVFWLRLPEILGLPHHLQLLPLIGAPIAYGVLWALVMKPLNKIVGLTK